MAEDMPFLSEWLEAFNQRMGQEGVPHLGRPQRAWLEWCRETGERFGSDDPKAKQIFGWFESQSPEDSLSVPNVFTGAFYFDAYFWHVDIRILYGTQKLVGRDVLLSMPASTMEKLFRSVDDVENFRALWADCLDYGYGIRCLHLDHVTDFWQRLVQSGDSKLRSAVENLCKPMPGPNAMQSSREACEMFLKAFLARNDGLIEDDARKKYSHDLSKLLDRIIAITPNQIFTEARKRLSSFPAVDDRYKGKVYPGSDQWSAFKVAQTVAAEVIRGFTTQNVRAQLATRF
jgi:hypothetical protein